MASVSLCACGICAIRFAPILGIPIVDVFEAMRDAVALGGISRKEMATAVLEEDLPPPPLAVESLCGITLWNRREKLWN